jgi:hypothetical protein
MAQTVKRNEKINNKRKNNNKNNNKRSNRSPQERQQLAQAIESIGSHESSLSALRLMMEFGSVDEKWQAMLEIKAIAFRSRGAVNSTAAGADGRNSTETVEKGTDSSSSSEDESEESSS